MSNSREIQEDCSQLKEGQNAKKEEEEPSEPECFTEVVYKMKGYSWSPVKTSKEKLTRGKNKSPKEIKKVAKTSPRGKVGKPERRKLQGPS